MTRRPGSRRQAGAASLAITLLLFFAMLLVAGFVHRNLRFESHAAANQVHALQAFEAAEAGLEWAQARLNTPQRIGADCRPSADPGDDTFRERYLRRNALAAPFTPRTMAMAGTAQPLRAACVRQAGGWACSCPSNGEPALAASTPPAPAFSVSFSAGEQAGVVQVTALGCSTLAAPCLATPGTAEASRRLAVALALVPGLANPPAVPLTVRGEVRAQGSPGLHHADPAGNGVTVQAGGGIDAPGARAEGPPGTPREASWVSHDASLAGPDEPQLFSRLFRMDAARWRAQPTATRLHCPVPCDAALQAVFAGAGATRQMVHVDGDLVLDGGLTLGSLQRPVALVVDGDVRWSAGVTLYGLLYAHGIRWDDVPPGVGLLRGAAVAAGDYTGNGSPELVYDAAVLDRLALATGTFARVPGSWRDF